MTKLTRELYAPPKDGADLEAETLIQCNHPEITATGRRLTDGLERSVDWIEALFRHVDHDIANEPSLSPLGASALDCLREGAGDPAAKSRLLVALCRSRGIPARLVTGLNFFRADEKLPHRWVEAFVDGHWKSMCPAHHHYGRVPSTYLIFGFGQTPLVRERNINDLGFGFLVERAAATGVQTTDESFSRLRQALLCLSLYSLPPTEQRLVEFLLLLPIAALIVCFYRNFIGLASFGTFAPALLGLAFRDLHTLPGLLVFFGILLLGWALRRVLDAYHLLQVPRTSLLLSLVVLLLISAIVAGNFRDMAATKYVPLFPMVILTGMIERFWTLDTEDGTTSSFRTLLGTIWIAATIALVLSFAALVRHMVRYPETLGLVMACQLLIGRYTGYRVMELFRFRDFVQPPDDAANAGPWMVEAG